MKRKIEAFEIFAIIGALGIALILIAGCHWFFTTSLLSFWDKVFFSGLFMAGTAALGLNIVD